MKFVTVLKNTLVLGCVAVSLPVVADTFRCGSNLVSTGDSKATVMLKCGEPFQKDSFCQPVSRGQGINSNQDQGTVVVTSCENIEDWTYNPGPGSFLATLRFRQNVLIGISYGDKAE
jgi:hypothetical protein